MTDVKELLAERGKNYGDFETHAEISQKIKDLLRSFPKWNELYPHQREAFEMLAHKIGRIFNGDPHFHDSWIDIAGYIQLVADIIEREDVKQRLEESQAL